MRKQRVRITKEKVIQVNHEIKFEELEVFPPEGKEKRYRKQTLTVIKATEKGTPSNREKINWQIITNLPVDSLAQAIEKLKWYALRWNIENFHKILKSGCRAEDSRLRTADRLVNLISIFCILSWRIFWIPPFEFEFFSLSCQ